MSVNKFPGELSPGNETGRKEREMSSGEMVKIGIVGLGRWGKILLDYFRETKEVEVVALWSRTSKHLKEISPGDARFYTDLGQMFDKEELHGVAICTPPTAHLLPAQLAAKNAIHVFCEKPMAATLEDCDKMIEVCDKNNVKLMIAFKHRFAKTFSHVKRRAEEFGEPLWAMYIYPLYRVVDPGWKFVEEGTKGIIVENLVHAIDALRYLMGEVTRIYAEGDNFVFKNVSPPDSTVFTLRFCNGAIAAIGGGCTSDARINREYLDVHFTKGIAQIWGRLDRPFHLRILMREEACIEEHTFDGSDGVREEIGHFIDCIKRDRIPMVTGMDGKRSLEIALAVIKSIRENKPISFHKPH